MSRIPFISLSVLLIICLAIQTLNCSLIFVIEIYRHGARDPLQNYWNANEFKTKGELTPVGMRQHYILGKLLRSEYIENMKFLSQNFTETELYVYSTNVNRTIMSALSQLFGLYPLGSGPKLPANMNTSYLLPPFNGSTFDSVDELEALPNSYQPIPIHTNRLDQEYLLRSWDWNVCPIVRKWHVEQFNTSIYKELVHDFNETLMGVAEMVNISKETMDLWKLHDIYDIFQNDIFAGKDLPKNFSLYQKNMTFLYDIFVYLINFGSIKQKRTFSTPFFQKVINLLNAKIQGADNRKWIMFSAHDITLIMILAGLNFTSYECVYQGWKQGDKYDKLCQHFPTYASNLILELHNNSNTFKVKIRYNGDYLIEYEYSEFIKKLEGSLISDFESVCLDKVALNRNNNISNESHIESMGGWSWLLLGFVIGAILSGIVSYFLYKKYFQSQKQDRIPFTAELEVFPKE